MKNGVILLAGYIVDDMESDVQHIRPFCHCYHLGVGSWALFASGSNPDWQSVEIILGCGEQYRRMNVEEHAV